MGATETDWDTAHVKVADHVWRAPDGSLLSHNDVTRASPPRVRDFLETFARPLSEQAAKDAVLREFPADAVMTPMPADPPNTCRAWVIDSAKAEAGVEGDHAFAILTTEPTPAGQQSPVIAAYDPTAVTHAEVQTNKSRGGRAGCPPIGEQDGLTVHAPWTP